MMGNAQLFASYRGALHITDLCLLFFLEVPLLQDPDLPEERNNGNQEMVALLTALSQVRPSFPLYHRESEELVGISHIRNESDRTQISTVLLPVQFSVLHVSGWEELPLMRAL